MTGILNIKIIVSLIRFRTYAVKLFRSKIIVSLHFSLSDKLSR